MRPSIAADVKSLTPGPGSNAPTQARSITPWASAAYAAQSSGRHRRAPRSLVSSTLSGAERGSGIAACARAFATSRGAGPDRPTERTTERPPERTPERPVPSSRGSRTVMPPAYVTSYSAVEVRQRTVRSATRLPASWATVSGSSLAGPSLISPSSIVFGRSGNTLPPPPSASGSGIQFRRAGRGASETRPPAEPDTPRGEERFEGRGPSIERCAFRARFVTARPRKLTRLLQPRRACR